MAFAFVLSLCVPHLSFLAPPKKGWGWGGGGGDRGRLEGCAS